MQGVFNASLFQPLDLTIIHPANSTASSPPGGPNGKVIVRTKLLIPAALDKPNLSGSTTVDRSFDETPKGELRSSMDKDDIGLSEIRLSRHNSLNTTQSPPPAPSLPPLLENVVIRIEVQDTGVGIRPRDMIDNKLFSPYVQTEIGRHQGGKVSENAWILVEIRLCIDHVSLFLFRVQDLVWLSLGILSNSLVVA